MALDAIIFDLDGTLLHTMPDLAVAANEALRQMGLPERTQNDMLACMGCGGRWMIEHIVPADTTPEQRQQVFELWRELYIRSDYKLTHPFDGVTEALHELRTRGVKLGVLSNKFDAGVQTLTDRHFEGLFDEARGDAPPMPRKPDPTSLLQMIDRLGATPDTAAYVGDTLIDVEVARNAGVAAVGVSWGYDCAAPLPIHELDAYVHHPSELTELGNTLHPRI